MALSYAELIEPVTKEQQLATLLQLATLAGFPATSWQSGSVPRTLLEIEAEVGASIANTVREIALGGMIDEAEGDWLTLLCASVFQVERIEAVKTAGQATLTCSALAGPYTVAVGAITATNAAGLQFSNTTGGTLPSGGTLDLTFQAAEGGAAYNLAVNTLTIMLTPLAGVSLDNPAVPPSSTWTTVSGADVETDDQIRLRCKAKWATIGTGTTSDAYKFGALTASAEVKRVKVLEHSNLGVSTDGAVTLYLAGDGGPVGAGALSDVDDALQAERPMCVDIYVANTVASATAVTGVVTVREGTSDAAQAGVEAALLALQRSIDIGGTIYVSAIIEAIMLPEDVVNVVLSGPAADVALASDGVATLSPSLTYPEI